MCTRHNIFFLTINEKALKVQHKKAYFLPLTEFGLMSAPINTPIAFVMALARSDCATRGYIIAAVICGC